MDDLDIEKILGIRNVSEETENIIAEKYPALSDEQKKRILSNINISDPETGTEKQVRVVRDNRRKNIKNIAYIAACAAVLMIVAGAVLRYPVSTGPATNIPEVTEVSDEKSDESCPEIIINDDGTFVVPDLTGLDYDLVMERYREYFNFTTGYSNDDDVPCNQIMWQDTEPGYIAEPGYEIQLNVSLGPKMDRVPPLDSSFSIEEATTILEDKGFSLMIKYVFDNDIPEGYTVKTEPEANAEAAKGSIVTLYISHGSEKEQGDVNEENETSDDNEEVFHEETE